MDFKQSIINLYQDQGIEPTSNLILSWYGRSFYDENRTIRKEVYLTAIHLDKISYSIIDWKKSTTFKIEIREEETFGNTLGSIYNNKGGLVGSPNSKVKGIYTPNIFIRSDNKPKTQGLFALLEKTEYPMYNSENSKDENIYEDAPYYLVPSYDKKTEYIIPVHVINSFFYYYSNLCIHHIAYNTVANAFEKPLYKDGQLIIPFHSQKMRYNEAKHLSKFHLITGSKKLNYLTNISKVFLSNSLNSHRLTTSKKTYMSGEIPFDSNIKIEILGHYITPQGQENRKFLVYRIMQIVDLLFSPFSTENYLLWDLDDPRKSSLDRPDEQIRCTTVIPLKTRGKNKSKSSGYNTSIPIKEDINTNVFSIFSSSPHITRVEKTEQKEFYNIDNVILKEIEEYKTIYVDGCSTSNIGRYNELSDYEINQYYKLFEDAINSLEELKGYNVRIFKINPAQIIGDISLPNQIIGASIEYHKQFYYIFEYGVGTVIPMFRHENPTVQITMNELEDIIQKAELSHDGKWREIHENNSFRWDNVYVFPPLNHTPKAYENWKKGEESLRRRIIKCIRLDIALK